MKVPTALKTLQSRSDFHAKVDRHFQCRCNSQRKQTMSDLLGRSFRLAKTYLNDAKGRISDISDSAQEELTKALDRSDIQAGLSASDDPMARAQAKINAARGETAARREAAPAGQNAPGATDPIQTAYKIIGVPPGSDYLTVQAAVNRLRERCAPSRFPLLGATALSSSPNRR